VTQITGGRVSFRRVVQPAQYESKEGLVELTFSIPEGEGDKAQAFLDQTAQLAQAKALELVGLKPAVSKPVELKVVETAKPAETKEAAAAKLNAKDAETKEVKTTPKVKAKPADTLDDLPEIRKNPEDRKPPEDPDGLDGLEETVKEVTDTELRDAVNAWVTKHKNQAAVRELRAKYAGPAGGLVNIPQEKRQAFLKDLATLPSAA
jgi:hypothetical protein